MSQNPPPMNAKLSRWNGPKCGLASQPKSISRRCPASCENQSIPGKRLWSHPASRKIVSGNPYISVNMATTKALNAPSERQSRFVCGLKKLNANRMNTTELTTTRSQRPYAGASVSMAASSVVASVHEEMSGEAGGEEQQRSGTEEMRPVLEDEERADDGEKHAECEPCRSTVRPAFGRRSVVVRIDVRHWRPLQAIRPPVGTSGRPGPPQDARRRMKRA